MDITFGCFQKVSILEVLSQFSESSLSFRNCFWFYGKIKMEWKLCWIDFVPYKMVWSGLVGFGWSALVWFGLDWLVLFFSTGICDRHETSDMPESLCEDQSRTKNFAGPKLCFDSFPSIGGRNAQRVEIWPIISTLQSGCNILLTPNYRLVEYSLSSFPIRYSAKFVRISSARSTKLHSDH